MSRHALLYLLFGGSVVVAGCSKSSTTSPTGTDRPFHCVYAALPGTVHFRFAGFSVAELDTIIVKEYDSSFSTLKQITTIVADSSLKVTNDTASIMLYRTHGEAEVLVPATGSVYRISSIRYDGYGPIESDQPVPCKPLVFTHIPLTATVNGLVVPISLEWPDVFLHR